MNPGWISGPVVRTFGSPDFDLIANRPPSRPTMLLRDYLGVRQIDLELVGDTRDEILRSLLGLLNLGDRSHDTLLRTLRRRENLGSTGIGRGIAIPHCRSLVVSRLHLAYGRSLGGVDFHAVDNRPVCHFFLIVAPPVEVSGQYLPVLGKVAQFARDAEVPAMLGSLTTADELLDLLERKGL